MAGFFGTIAFLLFLTGIVCIGMAFWCVAQEYHGKWYDRGPAFLIGFVVSWLLALLFMLPAVIIGTNEYNDWAKAKCAQSGGYIVQQYRSDDLCVSEDGRIIPNWKSR